MIKIQTFYLVKESHILYILHPIEEGLHVFCKVGTLLYSHPSQHILVSPAGIIIAVSSDLFPFWSFIEKLVIGEYYRSKYAMTQSDMTPRIPSTDLSL